MSQWTVTRNGRTLTGYRRTHGDHTLIVAPATEGWSWTLTGGVVVLAGGRVDGPIAGMEAADYALAEVVR